MGRSTIAKHFPRRLHRPLDRMAWNPSSCAPHPNELLSNEPWGLPPREDLHAALKRLSAHDVVLENGQVVALSLSGRAFVSATGDLFRANPIRSLRLVAVTPFLAEVAQSQDLEHLTRLDLYGNQIGADGLKTLSASPHLASLSELGLGRNGLGSAGVEVLNAFAGRPRIQRLELHDNGLTSGGLRNLNCAANWPSLTALNLSDNPIGPDIVDSLFGSRVEVLGLENAQLGTDGAAQLAKLSLRPEILDLGFNRLGDAGVRAIVESDIVMRCTTLTLRGNFLRTANAIVNSPGLARIQSLDLRANPWDALEVEKLRERFGSAVLVS